MGNKVAKLQKRREVVSKKRPLHKQKSNESDTSTSIDSDSESIELSEPPLNHLRNKSLLVHGYIRQRCRLMITNDIIKLCYLFCDAIILYWDIYKHMTEWQASKMIDGPTFCIENVTLKFVVIKGKSIFPDYQFCLETISFPDNIKSISFYAISNISYSYRQSISRYYQQNLYHVFQASPNNSNKHKHVTIYTTKHKDFRTKTGENCKLMICAEILDIKYKDKTKEIKTQIQINKSIAHKWKIKDSLLKSIKNGTAKNLIVSPRFGIDFNWRLILWPDDGKGNTKLMLELLKLPNKVSSVDVRVEFGYNNIKQQSYDQQRFGYQSIMKSTKTSKYHKNKRKKGRNKNKNQQNINIPMSPQLIWKEETLLSSELYAFQSLCFTVDIIIIKAYRYSNSKSKNETLIPTHEWISFGIIQKKQTKTHKLRNKNIDSQHDEKNEILLKPVPIDNNNENQYEIETNDVSNHEMEKIQIQIKEMRHQQNENTNTLKLILETLQQIQSTTNSINERLYALENKRNPNNNQSS